MPAFSNSSSMPSTVSCIEPSGPRSAWQGPRGVPLSIEYHAAPRREGLGARRAGRGARRGPKVAAAVSLDHRC